MVLSFIQLILVILNCYDIIYIKKNKEKEIFFNYISFESVEYFDLFDYKSYKNEVIYNIDN